MDNLKKYINITDELKTFLNGDKFFKDESIGLVIENIEEINKKLKEKKYTVAVIAAMKAGKSTLFNAVLGEDILPNETNACTIAITEIKHSKNNPCKYEKFYCDGRKMEIKANSREELQEKFLNDIRESRLEGNIDNIEKYYIEHSYEALKETKYNDVVDNFTLIDTPGPNEASNGAFDTKKLKETAYFQLRNADAIIFVLDYQVYKSEVNATLLRDIFAGRNDLKDDSEKIFFAINKLDARTSKDGTKEQILDNVRQMIIHQTDGVISKPNVIGISALKAVYGRTINNGNITEKNMSDCNKKYSAEYEKKVIIDGEEYTKKLKDEELSKKLIEDSNIEEFEELAIVNTFLKASNKMIEGSKEIIKEKLSFLSNEIQAKIQIQDKGINELNEGINEAKLEIDNLVSESKFMFDEINKKASSINENMKKSIVSISSEFKQKIEESLSVYNDYYESTERSYLDSIANNMNRDCKNCVENFVLRKQDEFTRNYSRYRQSIISDIYSAINTISKRADNIIKSNLDININTSAMVFKKPITDTNSNFEIKSFEVGNMEAGDDFNKQFKRGASAAGAAALAGLEFGGPVGAVAGAIAGFLFGVGTFKSEPVHQERKYKLDTTEIKIGLLSKFTDYSNQIEKSFEDYLENEKSNINKLIESIMNDYLKQIDEYLNNLKRKFESQKNEREEYIKNLKILQNKIETFKEKLNS